MSSARLAGPTPARCRFQPLTMPRCSQVPVYLQGHRQCKASVTVTPHDEALGEHPLTTPASFRAVSQSAFEYQVPNR